MAKIFKQKSKLKKQSKFSKEDQRSLAIWAADCAEHILPYFEKEFPKDDRPRKAIEVCRIWVRMGIFKMAEIRGASLAAHAAAREAPENSAARFTARAAGQAVATAHVVIHALGAAWHGIKAAKAAGKDAAKEREWQMKRLPKHLCPAVFLMMLNKKMSLK